MFLILLIFIHNVWLAKLFSVPTGQIRDPESIIFQTFSSSHKQGTNASASKIELAEKQWDGILKADSKWNEKRENSNENGK